MFTSLEMHIHPHQPFRHTPAESDPLLCAKALRLSWDTNMEANRYILKQNLYSFLHFLCPCRSHTQTIVNSVSRNVTKGAYSFSAVIWYTGV